MNIRNKRLCYMFSALDRFSTMLAYCVDPDSYGARREDLIRAYWGMTVSYLRMAGLRFLKEIER